MHTQLLNTEKVSINRSMILIDWDNDFTDTAITVLPHQKLHYFFIQGVQSKESRTVRIELREHSALVLYGLTCATVDEKFRTDLVVSHKGVGATSFVNLKGIAAGRSHIIINGMINIEPQAQQSNARLEERILLLSPEARAETIPNLEIQADDVRAGHAATVSKISPAELFYLQSRGLTVHDATRLLVRSFLYAQLAALPEGALRDKIEAALSRKLEVKN